MPGEWNEYYYRSERSYPDGSKELRIGKGLPVLENEITINSDVSN